ncbi:uncharacterized protein LOC134829195 [Culicoides brevitarsis]|uniref:uncharacterized protein LOC134829195 n=1 Tax=Culicoides brevitarsis TaxID=469753 RepID=UPI00307BAB31
MKAKTKQNAVPAKLLKNSIFLRKIRVSPVLNIDILISKDGKLFEIQDGGVINNCTLKKIDAKSTLEFQLFFNYQNSSRNVFYLIKSGKYLNIIQRKSTLELLTCYENVQSIKILSNSGHPSIEIRLLDSSTIVTNLIDDENPTENAPFEEPDDQIVKKAKELLHEEKVKCQESFDSYANLYQNVCDELKTAPKRLRSENQLEKVILVPYANNWKRVHNGKFILGLPILNATSQRPITALNITATVFCEEITDFEYNSCLYRCAEDFHSVEELKQKLQNFENEEENYTDLHRDPKFEEEWTVSENGNLHGEESGIVIVTMDVKLLLDKAVNLQKDVFTFNCFVNYHVNDEKNVQHDLQLHFGDVQITQKELFCTELWINFKQECLIDLLAVTTSTSSIHLSFVYAFDPFKRNRNSGFSCKKFWIQLHTYKNFRKFN